MYRKAEKMEEQTFFFDGFEEGFEAQGWTAIRNGEGIESTDWQTSDYIPCNGSYSAVSGSWDLSGGAFDVDNFLISPQIDLKGVLKYQVCCGNSDYPENYRVLLSTTGNDLADFTIVLRDLQPVTNSTYEEVIIDLSAFEGQKGYIAFEHLDYDKTHLYIDDFCIYEVVVEPAGEWQIVEGATSPCTIEGLDKNTEYEYQIVGIKEGEEDAISDIATFTTITLPDVVLDANSNNSTTIYDNNGERVNVTIKNQTIKKDGKWWSICLPFDLELEGSILEGIQLRQPSGTVKEVDTYLIIDCLTECDKIEAGKPYMYKFEPGEDIVNPVFEDVVMNAISQDITIDGGKAEFFTTYFLGYSDEDYFYVMDGNIRLGRLNLQKDMAVKAFECYFYVDPDYNATLDGIGLNFDDNLLDILTGVDKVEAAEKDVPIYNTAGQRLDKARKGINIIGDKKVLVK